jgi:molybdopterin converting factor small subunit
VTFTSHLSRHVECPSETVAGSTVGEVLEAYVRLHPAVGAYLLDEQGTLRKHVVVFVDGRQAHDRRALSDGVSAASEVYVMQALSGG